ncbi:MAG: thiosulfate oxidation carrier complex protein SoxZ [Pseudomonadales bacterium]|nr:thiosulfate oxidation carrier complex protein SoxZ [Pseudomonadales bacterium]
MDELKPRIRMPQHVAAGEVFQVRTILPHPMETGYRRTRMGEKIPRHIVVAFTVHYNDELVFAADIGPGISSNPYFEFHVRASRSGELVFRWEDDRGQVWNISQKLIVNP